MSIKSSTANAGIDKEAKIPYDASAFQKGGAMSAQIEIATEQNGLRVVRLSALDLAMRNFPPDDGEAYIWGDGNFLIRYETNKAPIRPGDFERALAEVRRMSGSLRLESRHLTAWQQACRRC